MANESLERPYAIRSDIYWMTSYRKSRMGLSVLVDAATLS
jgi:hypothetical protein